MWDSFLLSSDPEVLILSFLISHKFNCRLLIVDYGILEQPNIRAEVTSLKPRLAPQMSKHL